jgi:cysteinyl-tRNA synthetase
VTVRIYSTLTGREEALVPLYPDGVLRMYVCGLTPKFHAHVGHARVFVAMDVIRRYLEYRGFKLKHVQNFTDVDDKIIQRAAAEKRDPFSTAQSYIDSYFESMDRLKILRAHEYPTVTGYMERIVEVVADLVETAHAYAVDGNVYFDVATFPEYGKLSRRDLDSQLVAARKELEPGKRDPRDFALWKRARAGEPSWPSPWGPGRPGWHIECSAMARETLGDQLDIHGGGADLIFPHHENEIAQSESLTGKEPFAHHWAHTGLLQTGGEKMAHSLQNFLTARAILDRYDPTAVRLYLIGTHYRQALQFVVEGDPNAAGPQVRGIEDAEASLARLRRALGPEPLDLEGDLETESVRAFEEAMDADFNTPGALAVIFDLAREVNRRRSLQPAQDEQGASRADVDRARRTMVRLLGVLGIGLAPQGIEQLAPIEPYVKLLLDVRRKLREMKQWALSDEIRVRLAELGVVVEDKPGGESTWRRAD